MSEEIKEVHIKTYDEWLKYYKNATKEQVIEDLTQDVKYFADAVKDIKELQKKLQQKENIIKALEIWLSDKYYGRNGHMDSDVIGIKDVLNYINELKEVENNE